MPNCDWGRECFCSECCPPTYTPEEQARLDNERQKRNEERARQEELREKNIANGHPCGLCGAPRARRGALDIEPEHSLMPSYTHQRITTRPSPWVGWQAGMARLPNEACVKCYEASACARCKNSIGPMAATCSCGVGGKRSHDQYAGPTCCACNQVVSWDLNELGLLREAAREVMSEWKNRERSARQFDPKTRKGLCFGCKKRRVLRGMYLCCDRCERGRDYVSVKEKYSAEYNAEHEVVMARLRLEASRYQTIHEMFEAVPYSRPFDPLGPPSASATKERTRS